MIEYVVYGILILAFLIIFVICVPRFRMYYVTYLKIVNNITVYNDCSIKVWHTPWQKHNNRASKIKNEVMKKSGDGSDIVVISLTKI